jgi:hypothetical protein
LGKYKSIKTKAAYEKQTEHRATLSSKPFFVIKECLHGHFAEEYITWQRNSKDKILRFL